MLPNCAEAAFRLRRQHVNAPQLEVTTTFFSPSRLLKGQHEAKAVPD